MQVADRYFVPDLALEEIESGTDTFEFEAVAATLVKLIDCVEPPFSIAILGPWGSGKTSLVNDVIRRLRRQAEARAAPSLIRKIGAALKLGEHSSRDLVVYVDAWKYENDSLRRQLLLAIEAQLKKDGVLELDSSVASRLYQETGRIEAEPPRIRWREVPKGIAVVGLIWFLLLGLILFGDDAAQRTATVLLQLATGITLYLLFTGQELFRRITTSVRDMPLVSPEQFENEFQTLVGRSEVRRLVLVLDNIDRMTPDAAIAALTTLKTYLEPGSTKGIYVVPLDDSALRAHLRRRFKGDTSEPDEESDLFAREYLRKFFGATVRVPPLSARELVAFAAEQLTRVKPLLDLPEYTRLRVAQVLARVPGTTPRRIKRHVNALSARLAILEARSELQELRVAKADLVGCLAMLAVIEEEWPDLFAALELRPWLLRQWKPEIAGTLEPTEPADEEERVARDRMRTSDAGRFIKAALPAVSLSNLRMLLRLKLDMAEGRVEDYEAFIDELEQGQHELVKQRIEGLSVAERRAHLDVALERLRWRIGREHVDIANSIGIAVLEPAAAWGSDLESEVATGVAEEYAARWALRIHLLAGPSVRASVWLIARGQGTDRTTLIRFIAERLSRPLGTVVTSTAEPEAGFPETHWQLVHAVAQALVDEQERFTASELEPVRVALSAYPPERPELALIWQNSVVGKNFVGDSFLRKRIVAAFAEVDAQGTKTAPAPALLEPLFALNSDADRDSLYVELAESVDQWLRGLDKKAQVAESIRGLSLRRWPLDRLPKPLVSRLKVALDHAWTESTDAATQMALVTELLKLRPLVGAEQPAHPDGPTGPVRGILFHFERDEDYVKWLRGLPASRLATLAASLTEEGRTTGADLLVAAVGARAADSATPSAERAELTTLSWSLAQHVSLDAELETAGVWLAIDPSIVVAHSSRLVEAMSAAPAAAEHFEALVLDAIDKGPVPETAATFLSALPSLHGKNIETLRVLIYGQLQQRPRRAQGESLLAKLGGLLDSAARGQIWTRFVEDARNQLVVALRDGKDWSGAQDELELLQRHRDEISPGARSSLAGVFQAGAESAAEEVRISAASWAIRIIPESASAIRDAFARRVPAQASEPETQALVAAADSLGISADVLWKLGEIADSGGAGAAAARQARERFLPPRPASEG